MPLLRAHLVEIHQAAARARAKAGYWHVLQLLDQAEGSRLSTHHGPTVGVFRQWVAEAQGLRVLHCQIAGAKRSWRRDDNDTR